MQLSKQYTYTSFLLCAIVVTLYFYLNSNHLTIAEKNWIDENHSTAQVININIINDATNDGMCKDGY